MYIYTLSLYLFFALIVILIVASYVLAKSKVSYAVYFFALCVTMSFYLFGYLMELNSTNLSQMTMWSNIQYLGIPFYGVLWLIVGLLYTKRIKILKPWMLLLFFIIPFITLILKFTNSYHHFFYEFMAVEKIGSNYFLLLGKGPWYFVQTAYNVCLLVVLNIIFISEYKKTTKNNKKRSQLLILASFLPYIGLIVILIVGIDFTAFITPISVMIVVYAIFKYDFLDIKATSRELIFTGNSSGMIITDNDNKIIEYNFAAVKFFALHNIKISIKTIEDIICEENALLSIFLNEGSDEYTHKDEYYKINYTKTKDKTGREIGKLFIIENITEKKKSEEELNKFATIDSLSELYNRRKFMELGNIEFERSQRYHNEFCLIMMDLDLFKNVNDKFGHAIGDIVLNNFGKLISDNFRTTDISGRLGGEEFSVILLNTNIDQGYVLAEKFRSIVEKFSIAIEEKTIRITVSIGITQYTPKLNNFNEMLGIADKAMYESKAKGRNLVSIKCLDMQ